MLVIWILLFLATTLFGVMLGTTNSRSESLGWVFATFTIILVIFTAGYMVDMSTKNKIEYAKVAHELVSKKN